MVTPPGTEGRRDPGCAGPYGHLDDPPQDSGLLPYPPEQRRNLLQRLAGGGVHASHGKGAVDLSVWRPDEVKGNPHG
jgi:hypothetical protein